MPEVNVSHGLTPKTTPKTFSASCVHNRQERSRTPGQLEMTTVQTRHLVFAFGVAAGALALSSAVAAPPTSPNAAVRPESESAYRAQIVPFLKKHCLEC